MPSRLPLPDHIERAERAVREYLAIALSPPYADLDQEHVLIEAEFVWDNYEPGCDPPVLDKDFEAGARPDVWKALVQELHRARRDRFGAETFLIVALLHHRDGDEHSLTCDLMWPGSNAIHAMRILVAPDLPARGELN